jgi:hypothetical protein
LEPISAAEATSINNGTTITYSTDSTAAYRMYSKTFRITVTDNSTQIIKGYLEVHQKDDIWNNKTEEAKLIPYIMNTTNWAAGPENCPLYGKNESRSLLIEQWLPENLVFDVEGEAYNDVERILTKFSFTYNYTVPNRINSSNTDEVTAKWVYKWDKLTGVMLKSEMTIINYNDSSLDGMINTTLTQTSLWGLTTEGIPGFPTEIVTLASIVTLGALYFNLRKQQMNRGNN